MIQRMMCASLGLALLGPVAARAQDEGELSRIRREIGELKAAYEARIRALESRLEAMQASSTAASAGPGAVTSAVAASGVACRAAVEGGAAWVTTGASPSAE